MEAASWFGWIAGWSGPSIVATSPIWTFRSSPISMIVWLGADGTDNGIDRAIHENLRAFDRVTRHPEVLNGGAVAKTGEVPAGAFARRPGLAVLPELRVFDVPVANVAPKLGKGAFYAGAVVIERQRRCIRKNGSTDQQKRDRQAEIFEIHSDFSRVRLSYCG